MVKKLLGLLLLTPGCISGKSDVKSDWIVLDQADSVDCSEWRRREKDLEISDIRYQAANKAFLVQGINRNTSGFAYQVPFDDDYEVDLEQTGNFQVGRTGQVAGLSKVAKTAQFIVFEPNQGKTRIEFRNISTNVVESTYIIPESELTPLAVYGTTSGVWLSYRNSDQVVKFAYIDIRTGKDSTPILASLKFSDPPKVTVAEKTGTLVLVSIADKKKTKFEVSTVNINGETTGPKLISTKVTYQIESFATRFAGSDLYLSYVDGDSLVGESVLKLVKISQSDLTNQSVGVKWTKVEPLKNVHVNEPVFVSSKKGMELLLLKWVDEESTIARYMVTPDGLGKANYAGVFKRGSRIMDAFAAETGRIFTVTRNKGSSGWEFFLCRL